MVEFKDNSILDEAITTIVGGIGGSITIVGGTSKKTTLGILIGPPIISTTLCVIWMGLFAVIVTWETRLISGPSIIEGKGPIWPSKEIQGKTKGGKSFD